MNASEIYPAAPSKFLKAADLQGRTPVVTIARVEVEQIGRARETKLVVYFRGKSKGLKLNKTMATALSAIAGSPLTERWVGTAVQLYATVADFGSETYQVVRVRAPQVAQTPFMRPTPAPPAPIVHDRTLTTTLDDDTIPF